MNRSTSSRPRVPRAQAQVSTGQEPTDWLHLGVLILAGLALLLLLTTGLSAQGPSREEALREHRERVARLLAERRAEREGEQQADQADRAEYGERGPSPQVSEGPVLRGSAELLSEPLNVLCKSGETFFTTVTLHNGAATEIDHLRVLLDYDPQMLRPLQVSDHGIRRYLAGEPSFQPDLRRGRIQYEGSLKRPFSGLGLQMLTVEWQTLVPTPRTRIALISDVETGSALLRTGRDVLGEAGDPNDGTIGTDVAIQPAGDRQLRGNLLIDDPESLRAINGLEPTGGVTLSLQTPRRIVRVGDILAVDIHLANPARTAIDDLRFSIGYDPEVFEVLDAAPGDLRRPTDNLIVGGVNLQDGPFHAEYPFDFLLRNEARNESGVAQYHMGLSRARPLPDGTVVRIYLRALRPARQTALTFLHDAHDTEPGTAVRCLGVDVLGILDHPGDGTRDLGLAVLDVPAIDSRPGG